MTYTTDTFAQTVKVDGLAVGAEVAFPWAPSRWSVVTNVGPVEYVAGNPTYVVELNGGALRHDGARVRVTPHTRIGLR